MKRKTTDIKKNKKKRQKKKKKKDIKKKKKRVQELGREPRSLELIGHRRNHYATDTNANPQ